MNYLQTELYDLVKSDSDIFEFLQNSALDGLWYWNLENLEDEWMNNRFWETLGYDPDKMPHKASAWQEIINQDDLALALENFERHKKDPSHPYDQVVRYRHSKGHDVWIRCRGLIIRDEEGVPLRMLGAHTDITKQKQSEVDLQLKLNRYNQVIEGADLATWEWNISTGDLRLNGNWANLLGNTIAYYENRDIDFAIDNVHPGDLEEIRERLIQHFREETDSFEYEMRLKNTDGGWTWTLCTGKVIVRDRDGKAELMTGYHKDISVRKASEQVLKRYKDLLDRTNEVARIGTWEVNLVEKTISWSEVTRQIHEVSDDFVPDLESGINFYREGKDRDRINKVFNLSVTEGKPFDEQLAIISAKGNLVWIRTIGVPVVQEGEVITVYGVFQDISKIKEAEQEMERLLAVKNEQNERLINFSYIVSHNLRSHSVNLAMLVQRIGQKYPESTKNKYFEMLKNSTDSLGDTIGHLNEVASMHATMGETLESNKLRDYVDKAIANVRPSLIGTGGKIENNVPENAYANIIPAYFDSILLNLLTNAIKYRSPDRPPIIKIDLIETQEHMIISVADNGLGINLDKHGSKIFGMYKVFHHNEDARGIGLFITKSQIEAMNGKITVDSEEGKGSSFNVYLKR